MALLDLGEWVPILDGDEAARALYERHYSAKKSLAQRIERGTRLFIGPGEKLVLATPCRRAVFAWRRAIFRNDRQRGVECAIFRNEGAGLSSQLIQAADRIADARWPGDRHFTFVNPGEVESTNPGYCFLMAGWRRLPGITKGGLLIFERIAA